MTRTGLILSLAAALPTMEDTHLHDLKGEMVCVLSKHTGPGECARTAQATEPTSQREGYLYYYLPMETAGLTYLSILIPNGWT